MKKRNKKRPPVVLFHCIWLRSLSFLQVCLVVGHIIFIINYVYINVDDIKEKYPNYTAMSGKTYVLIAIYIGNNRCDYYGENNKPETVVMKEVIVFITTFQTTK